MALTTGSIEAGRKILKELFKIEAKTIEKQWEPVLGNIYHTDQTFEIFRQLRGLEPAQYTAEGAPVPFDDFKQLFERRFAPTKVAKGLAYTVEYEYTNQYKDVTSATPAIAKSFVQKKNIVAANVDNLGFTDTTYGMNSEVLYSTTHSMGGATTGSNRPATDIAFGITALEQALVELRQQKAANGQPMPVMGQVVLKVPPALMVKAYQVVNSLTQPFTSDTATANYAKTRIRVEVIDYYTSNTAWFLRADNNSDHGLFLLEQMPYDIMRLPIDETLMWKWVAWESYIAGWKDWHGTWGTVGA